MIKSKIFLITLILFFVLRIQAQELHIFGGKNHDVYLGCLNCSKYDSNSIWDNYGDYGSKYSESSIWNQYGDYGSQYSDYSPWNKYASYPPVIVDMEGNFYGYFTVNQYHSNRADFSLVLLLYKFYDLIREDPSEWYGKIFEYD